MSLVPAVAYARCSTKKQDTSVADQLKAIEQFAAEKGYKLLKVYADDGISGDNTKHRRQFLQMIEDGKAKQFKAILVWSQNRFGRFDQMEASYYCFPLREAGITLVTLNKGMVDWNTFTGQLIHHIEQHAAHDDLIKRAEDVVRGQLAAAGEGSWVGGIPYGYLCIGKKKEKHLIIDPVKSIIVKRIFHEFVELGYSMNEIAKRLNREGIPSPRGTIGGWRFDSVRTILENYAYCGDVISGRYFGGKYRKRKNGISVEIPPQDRQGTHRGHNPENEWTIHRDRHEALVERETFAAAQGILAKGKYGRNCKYPAGENPFVFSCLLRCGKCGSAMYGHTGRGGKYRHYICESTNARGNDACVGTHVREDRILLRIANYLDEEWFSLDGNALAWRAERKEITSPDDLPEAFTRMRNIIAPPLPKDAMVDHGRLKKKIKELTGKIDRARGNLAFLEPSNIPAVQSTIRQLETEKEELEKELKKKPVTEQDINQEVMAVLRDLYWLSILFRTAAEETAEPDPEIRGEQAEGAILIGAAKQPVLKQYLRQIESIKVFTRITGSGAGTRHEFERGEIVLKKAPVVTKLSWISLLLLAILFTPAVVPTPAAEEPACRRIEDVIYGRKHGTALTMDVFMPTKNANGAAIIMVMSGGWFSSHDWIHPGSADAYVKRGYTVFAVVHGSQPKFTIPEAIQDMNRAVRFIRLHAKDYHIDPDRIGITGGSAGGHLSLMQGTAGDLGNPQAKEAIDRMSSRVQAVACFYPPTDFLNYGAKGKDAIGRGTLADYRVAFDVREYDPKTKALERITDEAKILELGRKISPITHVTAESPPTLIIHGDKDFLVPIQQAESIIAKLKEVNVPAELVVKPGKAHGWEGQDKDVPTLLDWFDKYLQKKPKSDK